MFSGKSSFLRRFSSAAAAAFLFIVPLFAQIDPDPNSPVPVLLSLEDSTRAFSEPVTVLKRSTRRSLEQAAYLPNQKIRIFVTNIELMKGEEANAFRVYIEDAQGRNYRFPVLDLEPAASMPGVYALTIALRDVLGFWDGPSADGDLLIGVTWRGLTSNRVRLGFGKSGGPIKDDPGAAPTPLLKVTAKTSAAEMPSPEYVGYRWSGDRIRLLEQATFGPTVELDSRIRRIGLRTWLAEQFEAPYPSLNNPYPNIPLKSTNTDDVNTGCGMFLPNNTPEYRACIRDHYSMYPVQNWFFKEAFYGDAQLRHRVAWALAQMWVVSGVDTQQSRWMIEYHKVLSRNAFGNYRTLMKEMTLNPAMGNYLDMIRSTRTNPNENYPREILQLFTIGLFMLNPDGTLQLDGEGNPIPTYDQNMVNNFTKVFTGWRACEDALQCPNRTVGAPNYIDPMLLNQANHDTTSKTLLNYPGAPNVIIPTGMNGNTELDMALDNIFYHPNVGPFVSKYLIQHLVTSDPTPAYVGRVAAVFNNNGLGVRGDLKAVVRAIILDPEARGDVKTDPNYGKLREPVQLVTNVLRHFNVASADLSQQSDGVVNGLTNALGQNVFNSPTVFNFYSPDYIVPGTAMPGPEFALMTTGTSIARANFGNSAVYSRINAAPPNTPVGTSLNLSEMQSLAAADPTGNQLLDVLNQRMMHGTMSPSMRSTILTSVTSIASTNPLARAQQAIYLVATSSQYQVQR